MAGFFDLSDPENAALLRMASGLLQAGAPSPVPIPFGVALGRGLQAAMAAERIRRLRPAATAMHGRPNLSIFGDEAAGPGAFAGLPILR